MEFSSQFGVQSTTAAAPILGLGNAPFGSTASGASLLPTPFPRTMPRFATTLPGVAGDVVVGAAVNGKLSITVDVATFVVEVVETSVAEVVVKRWVEDFAAANGLSVMPFPKGSGNFEKVAELAESAANPVGPIFAALF